MDGMEAEEGREDEVVEVVEEGIEVVAVDVVGWWDETFGEEEGGVALAVVGVDLEGILPDEREDGV